MLVRFPRLSAWLTLLLTTSGCASRIGPAGAITNSIAGAVHASCTVETGASSPIRLASGADLYVEAVAVAASGQNVLVAGTPNFISERRGDGPRRLIARDSVFGVVVGRGGDAIAVPPPIPTSRIGAIRASARPGGAWDVVFAEAAPLTRSDVPREDDTVQRLWHGVYDGSSWTRLRQIPIPEGVRLHSGRASELVRRGTTLAWAVRADRSTGDQPVVLFRSDRGTWVSEIVPTRHAPYVTLSFGDPRGLLLGVVAPGPDGASAGIELRSGGSAWEQVARVPVEGAGGVHYPAFSGEGPDQTLAWYAEVGERREAQGVSARETTSPVILDSNYVARHAPERIETVGAPALWVTDHAAANGREIRFVRAIPGQPELLARVPSPFLRGFRTATRSASEVILVGTSFDPAAGIPVSLILPVSVRCRPA